MRRKTSTRADVQALSLNEVLADVRPIVEPQVRAESLTYYVALADPDVTVWGDREKVVQVLLNLVSNAVKFTPARPWEERPGKCASS